MSIELVMPSTISFSVVPFSFCLQSFPASGSFPIHHIRKPIYWSFSSSINPSNEYPGLIFFRIDWFDLLSVQRTLKCLLQHHNLKASIFQCSDFLVIQLSRGCGLFLFLLLQVSYYKRKLHKAWALSGFLTWQHLIITISSFLKYSS